MKTLKIKGRFLKAGIVVAFGLLINETTFSQNNSLVINGAFVVMNGGTNQSPIYMVVNQNSTTGIVRNSGHIISENQYNFVKWNVSSNTGSYVVPFGVGTNSGDYVPVTFSKTTNNNSVFEISTWGTDTQNNPMPGASNVGAVTSMTGATDAIQNALDRFWDIRTDNGTTADLTFSYLGSENTTSNPTNNLSAQRWNGSSWDTPVNSTNAGVTTGVGTAGPFTGQSSFSPWVLIVEDCPVDSIYYNNNSYCENDGTNYVPFHTNNNVSGTYSATPNGLSINPNTGDINPSSSTPGTYTVVFTLNGNSGCPLFEANTTITIAPADDAAFSYSTQKYCIDDINPTPTISGTAGGTFAISPSGGVINPNTGEVDLAASGAGTYSIQYTAGGNCSATASYSITIYDNPTTPVITQTGNTLSVTLLPGESAQWFLNGNSIGAGPTTTITQDGTYSVTISNAGGCQTTAQGNFGTSSLNKNILNYNLSVYPNPTENQVNIVLEGNEKLQSIVVFDALGQEVINIPNVKGNSQSINLAPFTRGVYMIRIGLQNETVSKKIVKK